MKGRVIAIVGAIIASFFFLLYLLFAPKPYQNPNTMIAQTQPMPTEEWKNYAPPSQEFTISIPVLPQHAAEEISAHNIDGFIHYDIYFAQSKVGTTYVINVIEYPSSFDASNPDVVLNGVMQEMLGGNPANQLMKSSRDNFLGYPSLEFTLKNPDVDAYSRALLKGRKLYVLTVMDHDAKLAQTAFAKFTGSLQFLPPTILPSSAHNE